MADSKVKVRVVVFDVGGVIAGNLHWFQDAKNQVTAEELKKMSEERKVQWDLLKQDPEYGVEKFWKNIIKAGNVEEKLKWEDLESSLQKHFKIYQSTLSVIKSLNAAGYTTAVISNHSKEWFDAIFTRFGVWELFPDRELVVVSAHARCAKPSKQIFDYAFVRIAEKVKGVEPEEIAFVDDQMKNISSCGENMKWHTIHFNVEEDPAEALTSALSELGVQLPVAQGDIAV
tara:strand:+ start:757 stop:1446 length:690 start_codon:yes stop_codon:yes gene_type:complete